VRSFDLVIFDFDGTLADSATGIAACMRVAFESFGLEAPAEAAVRARVGLTLEESIRQLATAEVDVATLARRYRELHDTVAAPAVRLFPGAVDVLKAASTAGLQLVVVSHKARRGLRQLLAQFDLDQYFSLALGSDDVTAHKPDATLYERHIAPFAARSDRVLVVGDTATDIQFASNIGAPSCWAAYGYGDPQSCAALRPTYRLGALRDLLEVCALPGCGGLIYSP
jgi:phosphoglycolate phosphatase